MVHCLIHYVSTLFPTPCIGYLAADILSRNSILHAERQVSQLQNLLLRAQESPKIPQSRIGFYSMLMFISPSFVSLMP